MSQIPHVPVPQNLHDPLPMTLPRLAEKKRLAEPIVMVTAYDYPSAQVAQAAGVDVVLVGDSGAMTVLGYPSTVPVSTDEMLMLASAVRRGLSTPLLVGDLPFGSYEASDEQAIATAQRFIKEAGCDAVKLERGGTSVQRARAIVDSGIPVMGHVGLTPQTATALGGYRAQGRTATRALAGRPRRDRAPGGGLLLDRLRGDPGRGLGSVVERIEVPVIGIGAGPATDGQVLVFHDLLGIYDGHAPRFAKRFGGAQGADGRRRRAVRRRGPRVGCSRLPSTHTRSTTTNSPRFAATWMADCAGIGHQKRPHSERKQRRGGTRFWDPRLGSLRWRGSLKCSPRGTGCISSCSRRPVRTS